MGKTETITYLQLLNCENIILFEIELRVVEMHDVSV